MAAPTKSVVYYIGKDRSMYEYKFVANANRCVKKLYEIPLWVDDGSAIGSHNDTVVIVGGLNLGEGDKSAMFINKKTYPKDKQLPDLPEPRYFSGVVVSHHDMYVVGGYNQVSRQLDSVYHLSVGMDAWQAKKSMPLAVSHPLVIQYRQSIFVLGGQDVNYNRLNSVLKYNIDDDAWKLCRGMPVACDSHVAGVVVYKNNIKVITEDRCVTYDVDNDKWFDMKLYKKLSDKVNAFVYRGQICAAVQNGDIWSMISYHDVFNVWKIQCESIDQAWWGRFFC